MIKRYNQFVNEKVNEDLIGGTEETTRREIDAPPSKRKRPTRGTEVIPSDLPSEEPNPLAKYTNDFNEEEEGDIPIVKPNPLAKYTNDFNEVEEESGLDTLAKLLAQAQGQAQAQGAHGQAQVEAPVLSGNVIHYDGHEIDQPSETGEFRVDGIDLKTKDTEKVIDYLNNPEAQAKAKAKKAKSVQAQAQKRAKNEFEPGRIDPELEAKSYKYTMEVMERSKSRKERRLK